MDEARALPKQARYQLRYTRLWNCFICGLTCGHGHFLTTSFSKILPASGSVPAGCGVGLFSSWMGEVRSQKNVVEGRTEKVPHSSVRPFYFTGFWA